MPMTCYKFPKVALVWARILMPLSIALCTTWSEARATSHMKSTMTTYLMPNESKEVDCNIPACLLE